MAPSRQNTQAQSNNAGSESDSVNVNTEPKRRIPSDIVKEIGKRSKLTLDNWFQWSDSLLHYLGDVPNARKTLTTAEENIDEQLDFELSKIIFSSLEEKWTQVNYAHRSRPGCRQPTLWQKP